MIRHKSLIKTKNKSSQTSKATKKVELYYQDLQNALDELIYEHKLPFTIDLEYYTSKNNETLIRIGLDRAIVGDGCIYTDTTAPSVIECCKTLIKSDYGVGLWGLMQSGKSQVMFLAAVITAAFEFLKSDKICVPILLSLVDKSVIGQLRAKAEAIRASFGKAIIRVGDKPISIDEFLDRVSNDLSDYFNKQVGSSNESLKRLWTECKQYGTCIILPCHNKFKDLIRHISKATTEHYDGKLILCRDEVHFGVHNKSVADQILTDSNLYDLINYKDRCKVIFCSATNWVSIHLPPTIVHINNRYCGISVYYKENNEWKSVSTNEDYVQIKRKNMSDFASEIGSPILPLINYNWYSNKESFLSRVESAEIKQYVEKHRIKNFSHSFYCDEVENGLVNAICYLLVSKNPQKRQGMLIRFAPEITATEGLIAKIQNRLKAKDIKVIKAFGNVKYDTIENLLRDNGCLNTEQKYIVFAVAKARVSDSFPPTCGYGLDLSRETVNYSTILQGVLGRLCGYNKNSMVILSDNNSKILDKVIKRKGKPHGNLSRDVRADDEDASAQYHIDRGLARYPVFNAVIAKMEKLVNSFDCIKDCSRSTDLSRKTVHLGRRFTGDIWKECIEPHLDQLESLLEYILGPEHRGSKLLLPEQISHYKDEEKKIDGRCYQKNGHLINWSWRSDTEAGKRGGGKSTLGNGRSVGWNGRIVNKIQEVPALLRGLVEKNNQGGQPSYRAKITGFEIYIATHGTLINIHPGTVTRKVGVRSRHD